ncbi:MAG: dienelactone hydrolase family protein [Minicystis sp.]
MTVAGFTETSFTHEGATRAVYRRGAGPAVVVMHEIPGITPQVAAFATRVADEGFSVFLPHLFGTPNKPLTVPYAMGQLARACVSREFSVLAARGSSPITSFLRALCRHAHAEIGGKGVGAIGMCLTGNFALALMVDPVVMAPVLSQPSLPFPNRIRAPRRPAPLRRGPGHREEARGRGLPRARDALHP